MSNQVNRPTRRAFVSLIPGALALSGCVTTQSPPRYTGQSQPRYTGPAYRVVEYQSGQKPGTGHVMLPVRIAVAMGAPQFGGDVVLRSPANITGGISLVTPLY